ncbi:hypothetical protein [Brevundimonas diminuta]|nr:hypothetical protein [Brevundimonas diminuta]
MRRARCAGGSPSISSRAPTATSRFALSGWAATTAGFHQIDGLIAA